MNYKVLRAPPGRFMATPGTAGQCPPNAHGLEAYQARPRRPGFSRQATVNPGNAAVCTMLGRSMRRRSAQRLTPGTRCQYLWDLRRDRKSQSKGCPDRTFLNEPALVAGCGSVRQLHHASLHCVHSAERPSGTRKIIFSSGILSSRSSAVRARYFCNGKTLVYKRTIVLKKFSGFLDISQ
jgi:hypothetical protein